MDRFFAINNAPADAHAFRVTLNILLHSRCCPDDLAEIITKLRDEHSWNRHNLTTIEMESIYANVDGDLCADAVAEWDVDTSRMRDWGFPWWRADHTDWWDGENRRVDCRLCGHRDNRYEFPLVNRLNGNEIWTGSTCIVKYGVTVDGEACAETALGNLRKVMAQSKKAQTKHEWCEEHPDADAMMDRVRAAMSLANRRYINWKIRNATDDDDNRLLPLNFDSQRRLIAIWGRAAIKYFDKNGYLTPQRTNELYTRIGDEWHPGQMVFTADALVSNYAAAENASDGGGTRKRWDEFIRLHPNMNDYQRRQINYFRGNGYTYESLYDRNRALVDEIRAQHAAAKNGGGDNPPVSTAKVPFL